jgi:hypothetical protein
MQMVPAYHDVVTRVLHTCVHATLSSHPCEKVDSQCEPSSLEEQEAQMPAQRRLHALVAVASSSELLSVWVLLLLHADQTKAA